MKRTLSLFLAVNFIALVLLPPDTARAYGSLPISAPTAVLLDENANQLVYAKTPHLRRAPASTTKVLTAIVALETLPLDTVVVIPKYVEKMEPSKIYLKRGEKYYVRDLIRAILLNSANDAAEALAYAGGKGSRWRFAEMMNRRSREIGCLGSHFVNPSGLPDRRQYSTAYDLALIMRHGAKYPFIAETMKARTLTIRSLAGRRINLRNHNKMLWRDRREVIGKTGWTRAARHCFVGSINLGNRKVFVSMLGSHRLWRDLTTLVDYQWGMSFGKTRKGGGIQADRGTKAIQLRLRKAGFFKGKIDGVMGPVTRRAVKRFQAKNGLKADGVVGSRTARKLARYA